MQNYIYHTPIIDKQMEQDLDTDIEVEFTVVLWGSGPQKLGIPLWGSWLQTLGIPLWGSWLQTLGIPSWIK